MHPKVARYATSAVPRYTSYPSVPHFSDTLPPETYAQWLGRVPSETPISLYVHIPFCRQLCWYCGCNMRLANRYEPVARYVDSLLAEIALSASRLPARMSVAHLHFGGGTPTALEPDDLERVMQTIRAHFDLTHDAELAIEVDPRTLSEAMIARVGALGFNRASFGVQEFAPEVQNAINRVQSAELVAHSIESLRAHGVERINLDLIYGLPYQTAEGLAETVAQCLEMAPDRIALFGYAHVPWMAKKQRLIDEQALPGPAARAAQAAAADATLTAHGLHAIGLDHFARPEDPLAQAAAAGTLKRNFQGYTADSADTLIAFGTTAIAKTPDGYAQNLSGEGPWARAVASGVLPIARGHTLTSEDRLRGEVIERLMCDGEVDVGAISHRHEQDVTWALPAFDALSAMAADGLVTIEDARVALTPLGRPLLRVVAAEFDAYREAAPKRHSVAV